MLTPRERVQACLTDDPALDRPPVALWRHFPVDDQEPDSLAAAILDFQHRYEFDFVKVTPASSYCVKDWGVEDVWEGDAEGTRRYTRRVVQQPADWERLPVLDPQGAPSLAGQLSCLRLLRSLLGPHIPILATIFSPLAQAKNLAGGERLLTHLRRFPEAVQRGLETITETTCRFVQAAIEAGIDGIFYAVQHARASLLTVEEYRLFGLPFDRRLLQAARPLWCNLLHLHGTDIYFPTRADLADAWSFPILNWHDRETWPSLIEARQQLPEQVLCGGLRQQTLVFGDATAVRREAEEAIRQTGGRRFILATGCVTPIIAPHGNLRAARLAVEQPHRE
jgi:uroporphyrinogen decarboxylase